MELAFLARRRRAAHNEHTIPRETHPTGAGGSSRRDRPPTEKRGAATSRIATDGPGGRGGVSASGSPGSRGRKRGQGPSRSSQSSTPVLKIKWLPYFYYMNAERIFLIPTSALRVPTSAGLAAKKA